MFPRSKYILAILLLTIFISNRAALCQNRSRILAEKVPFNLVVQLANQVISAVNSDEALPARYTLITTDGAEKRISAAQALGLLAQTTGIIYNATGSAIYMPDKHLGTPVVDEMSDLPRQQSVLINTKELLAEAILLLEFSEFLGGYPSAVWIKQERRRFV